MAKLSRILVGAQALLGLLNQVGADHDLEIGNFGAEGSGDRLHLGLALILYELSTAGVVDFSVLVKEVDRLKKSASSIPSSKVQSKL